MRRSTALDLPQRPGRGGTDLGVVVLERPSQRGHRSRVLDLPKGPRGGFPRLTVVVPLQRTTEHLRAAAILDLPEGPGGPPSDLDGGISVQYGRRGATAPWSSIWPSPHTAISRDARIGIFRCARQTRDRCRHLELTQGPCGGPPHARAAVIETGPERIHPAQRFDSSQGLGGGNAHFLIRVAAQKRRRAPSPLSILQPAECPRSRGANHGGVVPQRRCGAHAPARSESREPRAQAAEARTPGSFILEPVQEGRDGAGNLRKAKPHRSGRSCGRYSRIQGLKQAGLGLRPYASGTATWLRSGGHRDPHQTGHSPAPGRHRVQGRLRRPTAGPAWNQPLPGPSSHPIPSGTR